MNSNNMQPTTLDEAIAAFAKILNNGEVAQVVSMAEDDLITLHHGLGTFIRNNWGLWDENSPLYNHMRSLGFLHADDMSMSLIREFWNRANKKPSQLAEEIAEYKDYWDKNGGCP